MAEKRKSSNRKWLLAVLMMVLFTFSFAGAAQAATLEVTKVTYKDVRNAASPSGKWMVTEAGEKFKTDEGNYIKSSWIKVNGNIYYMNSKGYRVKGWIHYDGAYYMMDPRGVMVTGWKGQYYFKANGKRASKLTVINGKTYYFGPKEGKMKTGWIRYASKWRYFMKDTGVMAKNKWIQTGSKTRRYVDKSGVMLKSCWLVLGNKKYYLDSNGDRVVGENCINDKWYYFDKYGVYDPTKKITTTVDPSKKMVALTFDDGPGPYTGTLLNCLKQNNARATFFMVGSSVGSRQSVVRQMLAQRCELGNHSYSHPNMENLSTDAIRSEVTRTNSAIKSATGQNPTVMRLPYGGGHNNSRVLGALGLPSIYWSIDTMDWANTGNPQSTINAVLNNVRSGDIVLMHDIHQSTVQAALTIIPELKRRGYQMVTVTELAKYKGKKNLYAGTTYYNFK